jgi:hypothetical protein
MKTNLVEVIMDYEKMRPRVTLVNVGGWVRFPKRLRQVGKIYSVERIKQGKSGSWIACGEIKEVA